jgi:uncharacterized protein YdeI (YjbR/CyaY-like superfamily)
VQKQRSFPSRAAWRSWLQKNHAKADEIWLIYYKKGSGKASIDYEASVEEALCFGWIDGIRKRVDAERYMHRFSPRRRGSRWSPLNVARVERLIAARKMTPAGLAVFEPENQYDEAARAVRVAQAIEIPPEIEQTLRAHDKAWRHFTALAPSYRKQYVLWLLDAKKPETRARRLAEAISLLARNEKLGMK